MKTIEIVKLGNPEFNNKYLKPQKKPKHIRKVDWESKRNGFTMLIEEAKRYEKQIEDLQSKIIKLAELNQKAFEVNIELSHKLLTYDKLDQVKRLPVQEGKNENR